MSTSPATITLLSGSLAFSPVERGTDTAKARVRVTSNSSFGGADYDGAGLIVKAERPGFPGAYVADGVPVLDEIAVRMQVVDQDSSITPGQVIIDGSAQNVGAGRRCELPALLAGDSFDVDVWIHLPASSGQAASPINLMIEFDGLEFSYPVEAGVTEAARGIYQGVGASRVAALSGLATTETGTPDANANVAPGSWLKDGIEYTDASSRAAALNQNDGAAAALVTGEEYKATISRSTSITGVTVTKGVKATSGNSIAPTCPTGEVFVAIVTVAYHATASVIHNADIDQSRLTYYRGLVTWPATGLSATVHAVEALSDGGKQRRAAKIDVVLNASATNEIWLDRDGTVVVTVTTDPPSPGAHRLWSLVTSGSAVTGNTDRRVYITAPGGFAPASRYGSGGADPVTLAESQISGLSTDLASFIKKDGSVAYTGAQSMGSNQINDVSDPSLDTDADTQGARKAAITAAVPYPVVDVFAGDGVTTTFTLTKTPVVGTATFPGPTTVAYGGPMVSMGDVTAMVLKFPGSSADANHYTLTGTDLKTLTPGVVLPVAQYAMVNYFSTE